MADVGTFVLLNVDSKLIVGQTSLDYNQVVNMIEMSSKTSGNDAEFVPGRVTRTLSVSSLASETPEATEAGFDALDDAVANKTKVQAEFTQYTDETAVTPVAGASKRVCYVYVSNLSKANPDNDKSTFSCDLQITGAVTKTVNA